MRTPEQMMAESARQQMLNVLRGYRHGVPFGWTQEQWSEMLRIVVERAREAGLTDEEIRATGFQIP